MKPMVYVYNYCVQGHNRLFRKPPLLGPPLSLPDTRTYGLVCFVECTDKQQLKQLNAHVFSARATHDARCFSIGFYLTGKVNGQMRVSEGTLPLGVKPRVLPEQLLQHARGPGYGSGFRDETSGSRPQALQVLGLGFCQNRT